MPPEIDIVIAVHASEEFPMQNRFIKCYETLCQNTLDFRLILVDDFCYEPARKIVEEIASRKRNTLLVRTGYQRWFSRAYNIGLRLVRTPRVVILNADTEIGTGWLEELKAVWSEAESQGMRVGLVGSVMSPEEPRRWFSTAGTGYVTAHCWLASMQALFEVSAARGMPGWYFDEVNLKNAHIFSDNDVCYSMNRLGWATIQSHKSWVGHVGGASWGHQLHRVFNLQKHQLED